MTSARRALFHAVGELLQGADEHTRGSASELLEPLTFARCPRCGDSMATLRYGAGLIRRHGSDALVSPHRCPRRFARVADE